MLNNRPLGYVEDDVQPTDSERNDVRLTSAKHKKSRRDGGTEERVQISQEHTTINMATVVEQTKVPERSHNLTYREKGPQPSLVMSC